MINRSSPLAVLIARSMQTLPADRAQTFLQRVHLVPLLRGNAEAGELVGTTSHLLHSRLPTESTADREHSECWLRVAARFQVPRPACCKL